MSTTAERLGQTAALINRAIGHLESAKKHDDLRGSQNGLIIVAEIERLRLSHASVTAVRSSLIRRSSKP